MAQAIRTLIDNLMSDYRDVSQDVASKDLSTITKRIKTSAKTLDGAKWDMGALFLAMGDSGLAVAAQDAPEDGTRDFSEDGRTSATAKVARELGVSSQDVAMWSQAVRRTRELAIAGVDTSDVKISGYKRVPKDIGTEQFVNAIIAQHEATEDDAPTPKLTQKNTRGALVDAGLVEDDAPRVTEDETTNAPTSAAARVTELLNNAIAICEAEGYAISKTMQKRLVKVSA